MYHIVTCELLQWLLSYGLRYMSYYIIFKRQWVMNNDSYAKQIYEINMNRKIKIKSPTKVDRTINRLVAYDCTVVPNSTELNFDLKWIYISST